MSVLARRSEPRGVHPRTARLACVALAAVLVLASSPASAFAPSNGAKLLGGIAGITHQDITERAVEGLYPEFFSTSRKTKSMKKALAQIVEANAEVDATDQFETRRHFDGNNFAGAIGWINEHAAGVLAALNDDDVEGARRELGQGLHTLQDFYAHSNWIELGNSGANPTIGRYGGSLSPPTVTYCVDCTPCVDCGENIVGNQLVTGYYGGQDKTNPGTQCRHGGAFDSGAGPGGGINKDTNVCLFSPHCALHGAAATAAMVATMDFLRSIKDRVSKEQLKKLFGVGSSLAMAVDTTGSMSDKTMDVISEAVGIVNDRLESDDVPLKFVLSEFNDPDVGPVTVTDDPDEFKSALGGLRAEDGEDCEEPSMAGLLNAISASDENGEVFLFTDASAKDSELAGAVASLAEAKKIKVYTALSGTCSPVDSSYIDVAKRTGGQLLFLRDGETAHVVRDLLDAVVRSDLADLLFVTDALSGGTRSYTLPVDPSLSRITFSVSVVRLDASLGDPPVVSITRPDGASVAAGDPDARVAALSSTAIYTITDPSPGTWSVSVSGTGAMSLKVLGASTLRLEDFAFVRLGGDAAHQGFFRIPGAPSAGTSQTARANMSGDYASLAFALRSEHGDPLMNVSMAPVPDEDPSRLYGNLNVPTSRFVVYATGIDASGFEFQRVLPRAFAPTTVEVSAPTDLPIVEAGATATFSFTVTNLGPDDTFRVNALDTRGYVTAVSATTLPLASGASDTVTISVSTPAAAAPGALDRLVASVESTTGTGAANSTDLTFTIRNPDAALVGPPRARDVTESAVTLEWTAPFFDASSYSVQRAPSPTGPWEPVASGLGGRTVVDSGLTPNTTYNYRIGAVNPEGATVWSKARSVTTSPPPPGIPVFRWIATYYVEAGWTPAAGAKLYKLERAPDLAGAPGAWAQTTMATSYLYQWDTGLLANTVYWYRVRARNGTSDGPYSEPSSAMTAPNVPGVPTFLDVGPKMVTVTWTEPDRGAATYKVERARVSKGPWTLVASDVAGLAFTDATVTANSTWWYRVRATNARGIDGAFTTNASVSTPVDPTVAVPAAPGAPTYRIVASTYVLVEWVAATGASTYRIERAADASGVPGAWIELAAGFTALSQYDWNVTPNTTYWYRVRATNTGGDGPYSTPTSAMTVPGVPGPLTIENVMPRSVTLSWAAPADGAASYKVQRAPTSSGSWTQIAAGVTAPTYTDTTVLPNATYWYRVQATNVTGLSGAYAAAASVTTPVDPAVIVPGAPGTPTYSSTSASYHYVSWTAATAAATYTLERAPDGSGAPGSWMPLATGITALKYLASGLSGNTAYWYRVRATNTGGEGPYSGASVGMTAPNAPGAVTFSGVAPSTVTVNWTAPIGGAASSEVDRGTSSSGPWTQLASGLAAPTYTDAAVAPNVTYWYRARATNAQGIDGNSTAGASVTTPIDPAVAVPGAPGMPTFSSVSATYHYVNWTAAAGASTYKVERASDISGAPGVWTQIVGPVTALTYLNSGLTANTAYWYRVRATNAGGDGPYSNARLGMTAPNAPGAVTFSGVAPSTVTVNWTAPTGGAATYEVDRGTSSSGPWTQLASGLAAPTYTDATVAANVTYWYRARATNAQGLDGNSTAGAAVTTPIDSAVAVPGAPGAPTFSSVSATYHYVNWTAAEGASTYKVERASDASGAPGAWSQIVGPVTALTYLNSGLTANTAYWYRVRATNAGGDGPYSNARLGMTAPNAPGAVTFSGVAPSTVTVNWGAPTGGAASYKVERANASSGPWALLAAGATSVSVNDTTVAAGSTYWYRVRATNATGLDGNNTTAASVTTPTALGLVDPGAATDRGARSLMGRLGVGLGSIRAVLSPAWRGRDYW